MITGKLPASYVDYNNNYSYYYHAVRWESDGTATDLGTLPNGTYSYSTGINNSGQVTGYSNTSNGTRSFIWDEVNGMVDIGVPNSTTNSVVARAINDDGVIVGYYSYQNTSGYWVNAVFTWDEQNGFTDLGFLGETSSTNYPSIYAYDINNNGQIVGDAYNIDGHEGGAFSMIREPAFKV